MIQQVATPFGGIKLRHSNTGYEALIMPGVKIGNGAIVSSRSVVTADVPSCTIVGGNPAKVVKARFEPRVVKRLEVWPGGIDQLEQSRAI